MTDKLAEAIAHVPPIIGYDSHQADRAVPCDLYDALLKAARSFHALPVVDVEALKQSLFDRLPGVVWDDVELIVEDLTATHPNGLVWKKEAVDTNMEGM